ncbi:hypothetical protein HK104_011144 [Borealophlyctis nickersoniae]|nr:hypothetical protein HK104_011144 [Borealophlyctis nickersoniae]
MRAALTHPLGGYYMKGDVFGTEGDFITSPEISQVFGELIGIWFITQWQALGSPKKIQFVELGPGRGTLISDMLRTLGQFKNVQEAITGVHLVEASPHLRGIQGEKLAPGIARENDMASVERGDGVSVHWHTDLETVPTGAVTFIVAHEFFDALPIYAFQLTDRGWREIMIENDESTDTPYNFRYVLAPASTKASATLGIASDPRYSHCKVGDRIEVSPDSYSVMTRLAKRINEDGGAALVVDYGRDEILGSSLRGIRKHGFTDPLSQPGESDLSTDVDFSFLKLAATDLAKGHGPITQSTFLQAMGIVPRMQMLLQSADAKSRKDIAAAYERLVGPDSMGTVYKVMAFTQSEAEVPYPFQMQTRIDEAGSK